MRRAHSVRTLACLLTFISPARAAPPALSPDPTPTAPAPRSEPPPPASLTQQSPNAGATKKDETPSESHEHDEEQEAEERKGDENAVAKANNPLTAATGVNLQNYFVPSLYGVGGTANQLLLRAVVPVKLGLQQVVRATLPLPTAPSTSGGDAKSGLGDLNVFDVLLFTKETAEVQFGMGPQVTFPTATSSELGTGKWQIGAASVMVWLPAKALLLGALVTWQISVASTNGGSSRPGQDQLVTQPIGIFQMGHGFYLRSTGSAVFNLHSGHYNVPFGIGAGKVVKVGNIVFNGFLEPQFTFLHYGVGQPAMQLFGGLNVQFY